MSGLLACAGFAVFALRRLLTYLHLFQQEEYDNRRFLAWIVRNVAFDRRFNDLTNAFKAYRTACLEDIGGLQSSMGWDGIDEYGARARGWSVHVLSELSVLHFKHRGSAENWWQARWEEGVGNAFMGDRPDFLMLRATYRGVVETPPVLGGLVLLAGFLWARLTRRPQVPDSEARAVLREEQRTRMRALLRGSRAPSLTPPLSGGGPAFWMDGGSDSGAQRDQVSRVGGNQV